MCRDGPETVFPFTIVDRVAAICNPVELGDHPLGMSGACISMTLVHQLERSTGKRGIATLCIGIGVGLVLAVERV